MSSSYIGKVLDNYRIIEHLGIGGMGVVFKAIHIKLDKIVALKMIAPGLTMNENFINRFQTEAKSLAKLEDSNIVRIYDLRADNDQWFIVMEFVEGLNLLDKIKKDGAFEWQTALPIVKQTLSGIGHAHSAGIIHRDLKPNNIMITSDQVVKVTDFGLAKDQSSMVTTMSFASGGTLYYMSPEQVKGISFTDKRSDIYSIGMTFYEMIAGTVPFKDLESDFDIRETIIRKDLIKPSEYISDIPALLESIVMKSLEKDPDKRYQSTDAMLDAIVEFEEKYPVMALKDEILPGSTTKKRNKIKVQAGDGPDTRFEKVLKKQSRDYIKKYGIISSILLVTIMFVLFYVFSKESTHPNKIVSHTAQLNITSTPADAIVYIDNDSVGLSPLNNYTLSDGSHKISLKKNEYKESDTLITVTTQSKINLSYSLSPILERSLVPDKAEKKSIPNQKVSTNNSNASLYAYSNPTGATIWIDGIEIGKTPIQKDRLNSKPHKIRIEKEGYTAYTNSIELESGSTTRINAKLSLIGGGLQITSSPENAKIKIDGHELAGKTTPVLLENISPGNHQVEVTKAGYHSTNEYVEIRKEQTSNLTLNLIRQNGKLTVQVRPWGSIYINNELQKASSDIKFQVDLPVEEYNLQVVHPTLGRWFKKVNIEADNESKIVVDFNRKHEVEIIALDESGNPLQAEVFIDDKDMEKTTPTSIKIRTGIHHVMVKKEGFISSNERKEIFVDKNPPGSLKFVLRKIN